MGVAVVGYVASDVKFASLSKRMIPICVELFLHRDGIVRVCIQGWDVSITPAQPLILAD